jgi:hypothetical protein
MAEIFLDSIRQQRSHPVDRATVTSPPAANRLSFTIFHPSATVTAAAPSLRINNHLRVPS